VGVSITPNKLPVILSEVAMWANIIFPDLQDLVDLRIKQFQLNFKTVPQFVM
jgi:hypothetical protein